MSVSIQLDAGCFQMASTNLTEPFDDDDGFQAASLKFTEPFDESDVSFSVEGKLIYANKSIVSMWSPVFKTMFSGGFKETYAKTVELPEKRFDDILELMCILHPPNKPVDGKVFIFQTIMLSLIKLEEASAYKTVTSANPMLALFFVPHVFD